MPVERYAKYQLTQKQLIREMLKTDRLILNVEKSVMALKNHADKSNSSKRIMILDQLKDLISEYEQENEDRSY